MRKIVSALLAAVVVATMFASATFAAKGNGAGGSKANGCAWALGYSDPSCSNSPHGTP